MVPRLRASALHPELIPGLLGVLVCIVWAIDGGGAAPTSWYPGALFFLGLLATLLVVLCLRARPEWQRPPGPLLIALILLGAFAAWNLLSISWADVKGDAWDGANRAVLYFTVFAVFAIPSWRASSAAIVLGVFAFGIACVAAGTLISINAATDPTLSFLSGNLVEPTGYHNATAALFLIAFFPAALLASRREVPWPLRGALLASAGVLLEMAIPAQSRGSAIVFPIALVIYLAVVPNRVRALLWLLPVAIAGGLAAPSLLDIYSAISEGRDVQQAISDAAAAVWLSTAVLFVVGTAMAAADHRIEVPATVRRRSAYGVGAVAAVATLAAVVVALNAIGNPVDWAHERWDDFKSGHDQQDFSASRFTGDLGSNRYDFWRVAIDQFEDHPIGGAGTENFAVDYLEDRRSAEEPQHPHSLEMRLLGQTGLVGTALFAGFLVAAVAAIAHRRRWAPSGLARGVAAAALATAAYWLGHSSGDWLWVFPALTAPALALMAIAGRVDLNPSRQESGTLPAPGAEARRRWPRPPRWVVLTLAAGALVFVAVSYVLPLAAAEDMATASSTWGADPQAAFDRLDRAGDLNFLSDEPDVVAGAIAERLGEQAQMRRYFEAALQRNSFNWYSLLELGALDAVEGHRTGAVRRLRQAVKLNPKEPLIRTTLARARSNKPVSLRSLDRIFLGRVCDRFGQTHDTQFCG